MVSVRWSDGRYGAVTCSARSGGGGGGGTSRRRNLFSGCADAPCVQCVQEAPSRPPSAATRCRCASTVSLQSHTELQPALLSASGCAYVTHVCVCVRGRAVCICVSLVTGGRDAFSLWWAAGRLSCPAIDGHVTVTPRLEPSRSSRSWRTPRMVGGTHRTKRPHTRKTPGTRERSRVLKGVLAIIAL